MAAKSVEAHSTISAFFCPVPPPPPITMLIYLEVWTPSLSIGVRFILTNVLSPKLKIVPE